ncbi:lytic transglycosylase domain-containing protein [Vibrio rotiferianus]|uniref:lytic transglycosylase domain-containing protein n=1 Tax=Vibrio rotiferianus TaxID=190895 RepID=UPI0020A4FA68|nr:lytic transglycosylase domain-containing protein [Vibrio rotiferianus]
MKNTPSNVSLIRSLSLLPFLHRRASAFLFIASLLISQVVYGQPQTQAIQQQVALLQPYQEQINKRLTHSQVLVGHIAERLTKKSLPKSLILIPMLESSYNTQAVSHAGAAGLWQLIPSTAKRFGLKIDVTKDERFNAHESTDAALDYLAFLYNKFGEDLSLTLAAYNAGEGRVDRAIRRAKTNHYSSLTLPMETTQYVARFYALNQIVNLGEVIPQRLKSYALFGSNFTANNQPLVDLKPLPPLINL